MRTVKKSFHLSPSQTIMAGFAVMILIGASLLNLPIASRSGESIGFVNALFTATSANCVTGLVVTPTATEWTLFGKAVILVLIQLGGLGFMTVITVAMLLIRRKISLRSRKAIQASFNQDDIGGMIHLVKKVVRITLLFELTGAVLLALFFYFKGMELNANAVCAPELSGLENMSISKAIWLGVFHSVSAFCNAGFDIIGDNSIVPFQTDVFINIVLMILIISGGLGFTVWQELAGLIRQRSKHSLRICLKKFSLHAKIVFVMTFSLIAAGMMFFLLFEFSNPETLGEMTIPQKAMSALFQSVTLRTAGFNGISQGALTEFSKLISCMLMLVGGSSVSTAGGMKTVTFGIVLVSMYALLRNRNGIEVFGRSVPQDILQKALTVVTTMLIVVFASTVLLHFTEGGAYSLLDLLYETCSAAGTVGVTTGITSQLTSAGKVVIMVCMYLGRLSPVTVIVALNRKTNLSSGSITMPEERVIIG